MLNYKQKPIKLSQLKQGDMFTIRPAKEYKQEYVFTCESDFKNGCIICTQNYNTCTIHGYGNAYVYKYVGGIK